MTSHPSTPGRRAAAALGWLGLAAAVAFGGAGLVSAANSLPSTAARPELTWGEDLVLKPQLEAAAGDLSVLTDDVDALGAIGRRALTALVDRDASALRVATDAGTTQLEVIAEATDALRSRLEAIPGVGPDDATRMGAGLRNRYDRLVAALSATEGLDASWIGLTRGSIAAMDLATSLAAHDTQTASAASLGRKGQYKKALARLDRADASLATSRKLRDRLAVTTDVTILTQWIDLNAAYDTALRKTWALLSRSGGRVTNAVRAAFEELRVAQERLPPDNRGLIVIMADVARGGLNQAVISIEEARRQLDAATDSLDGG
ncbi:MAG: hypothetical protein QOF11_325 [Chloroflexota bacterium]|jgi:hypothetical protein|nr:hypothetical protein [Chloroflexota bacterium]